MNQVYETAVPEFKPDSKETEQASDTPVNKTTFNRGKEIMSIGKAHMDKTEIFHLVDTRVLTNEQRKEIDNMEERKYTASEVHQIVDMVLRTMDYHTAPVENREQTNLDNGIAHDTSPSAKVVLTVQEAAEELGISKPKVYELVRAGKFHTVNIGKKILISRQSMLDWIKKGDSYYGKEAC